MEMLSDGGNNSILVAAAMNNSPGVFGVVLSGVEKDVTPQEVRDKAALIFFRHKHVRGSDIYFASSRCEFNLTLLVNDNDNSTYFAKKLFVVDMK